MVQQIGSWISQYGRLLRSLAIKDTLDGSQGSNLADCIAASLTNSTASGHLKLQSLKLKCSHATSRILQQLSPQFLTGLDIIWNSTDSEDQQVKRALGELAGLQQLSMETWRQAAAVSGLRLKSGSLFGLAGEHGGFAPYIDPMIPALAPLTSLTSLELKSYLLDRSLLEHLPPQLQELNVTLARVRSYLGIYPPGATASLQLAHLTALTRLDSYERLIVCENDVLPINLKVLAVCDCWSCQPLLQLQQLQELSMTCSTTPADELLQLNQMTALTDMDLRYDTSNSQGQAAAQDASVAWPALHGLQALQLDYLDDSTWLTVSVLLRIKQASSLRHLHIAYLNVSQQGADMLPAVLRHLTALTALHLERLTQGGNESPAPLGQQAYRGALQVNKVLACSMASLPKLASLCLEELCIVGPAAAAALAKATQLTSLSISDCRLTDGLVLSVLQGMRTLRALDLSWNRLITDVSGPAIAKLTQLTGLYLDYTSMELQGLQCLSCLHGLHDCILPKQYQWDARQMTVVPACV